MRRLRTVGTTASSVLVPTLTVAVILLAAVPIGSDPPILLNVKTARARDIVDYLRAELAITSEIDLALVKYHPLVFSVEPQDSRKRRFRVSMEAGFLLALDDDEMLGALAHEMGHVWIYLNHPYLQTEMLANMIGQRVAPRRNFEKVYTKLWAYERTAGVPMDELLGPSQPDDSITRPEPDAN
ncbi:MAG TPA: hypothetical protein VFR18_08895 [Terriglobia bacterium]|nr:hypothetical protein [Terriglobia bacterium]